MSADPTPAVHCAGGTADDEDLPARTAKFVADAEAAGLSVELHWCDGAAHGKVVEVCADDYATWIHDFLAAR